MAGDCFFTVADQL